MLPNDLSFTSNLFAINEWFNSGIIQSKVAVPPIGIETLTIGETDSASVIRSNRKLVRKAASEYLSLKELKPYRCVPLHFEPSTQIQ